MTASGSMTMATLPAVLADGVMAARIAHGVARPPLDGTGPAGGLEPAPVLRLAAVTQSLMRLRGEARKRVEQHPSAARMAEAAAQPDTAGPALVARAAADAAVKLRVATT